MRTLPLLTIILSFTACESDAIMYTGENNARRYVKKMGVKALGVSCSARDSEMDGYTSCDVNTAKGVMNLECSYRSGGGCKTRMNKMQVTRNRNTLW